jgi:uncharacterized membrane protein YfcA
MENFLDLSVVAWGACLGVAVGAGFVKGLVGFAMPMVMISGLSSVVAPELALAGLILPTVVTNLWQALRQGPRAAIYSISKFKTFLGVGLIFLLASAQLVRFIDGAALLLLIGVPISLYAVLTLAGLTLRLPKGAGPKAEAAIGAVAGFFGGISGVWGPPTVAMLMARETEKGEQMRVQGVIYGLGALALTAAHLGSGLLNAATAPFSLALVVPAILGLWLGFRLHDRIDQPAFRKATLAVLLLAGLNLVRRGLMGG